MNIDRIRSLIKADKENYLSQYNNMDSFVGNFDVSECNVASAKRLQVYKSTFSLFVFFTVMFSIASLFSFSKNEIIALLQILFYPVITIISGASAYHFLSLLLDKRYAKRLYSKTQSQEERLKLLEASFTNAFNKEEISNEIFNDIKVQLSKEEYIELRTQHPEKISYQDLKIFLNEKERTQKISYEQQDIILTPEQIKAYSSRNIEA